jgi:predicted ATPase
VVVSHAERLIQSLQQHQEYNSIVLEKYFGQTRCAGQAEPHSPKWQWPSR